MFVDSEVDIRYTHNSETQMPAACLITSWAQSFLVPLQLYEVTSLPTQTEALIFGTGM